MRTTTKFATIFGFFVLASAGLILQAWVLGIILSWFNVSFSFCQSLITVLLANALFKPTRGSSK